MSTTRDASDPRWVQGEVSVAASPDEVWAQLKHVDAWSKYFSDIKRLRVLSCDGTSCKIELETKTLSHGALPYEVDFLEGRRMKVWTNEMGVKAVTYTTVRQGQSPNESSVAYSMFIEVSGVPSLLISEKSLRQKQEHMVATTLEDMNKSFARR